MNVISNLMLKHPKHKKEQLLNSLEKDILSLIDKHRGGTFDRFALKRELIETIEDKLKLEITMTINNMIMNNWITLEDTPNYGFTLQPGTQAHNAVFGASTTQFDTDTLTGEGVRRDRYNTSIAQLEDRVSRQSEFNNI